MNVFIFVAGMDSYFIRISAMLFPGLIWKLPAGKNEIYLTFDDGPHPVITPKVLNILDGYNAKATFFCVGENVQKYPETYAEIISRGHQTGNHTHNHVKGWKTQREKYLQNVHQCNRVVSSQLFRPPHGQITPPLARLLNKEGYKTVMWDVLTKDYSQRSVTEKRLQRAIHKTRDGSVVVFHDSDKAALHMLKILPEFLAHFSAKGFSFKSLRHLLV